MTSDDVKQPALPKSDPAQPDMFQMLCDNVQTSMLTYNTTLQELFGFKDEMLKHSLPPKLLVDLTVLSSKLFRSFSESSVTVKELTRMVGIHSSPWLEKTKNLKQIRSDYETMQRKLNIAVKKIELMSVEENRIKRQKSFVNWERLFIKTMEFKSHGRRWKFRIEPLKMKMKKPGFNPYLSDSSGDDSDENDNSEHSHLASSEESSDDEIRELDANREGDRSSTLLSTNSQKSVSQEIQATPTPSLPPIVTVEMATSTEDPDYDHYLLVQLYRPNGLLMGEDVCCTLAHGQQLYTSEIFPGKVIPGSLSSHQSFKFKLSNDAARALPPLSQLALVSMDLSKLTVSVYPSSIAKDMAAYVSLTLGELKVTENITTIAPPNTSEDQFDMNWEEIDSTVQAFPVEYLLKVLVQQKEIANEVDSEKPATPAIPLVCHRVKVQRHRAMHSATETVPWDKLLSELGYRLVPETQSRAVSVICFEDPPQEEQQEDPPVPEEKISQEELAAMTLQHAEEIKNLQKEFAIKLSSLSRTLTKVKAEKSKEIELLEQALIEAEQSKAKRGKSVSDMKSLLALRKKTLQISHGLPSWGQHLPNDFFERLELFAEESVRRQEELTERIKREVSLACEKQLATQHRLAMETDVNSAMEDVSLPALFMPTHITKHHVYTPRARKYFHPPGSSDARITQPPAVFKLPALHSNQLQTLNLFQLSEQFQQTGPNWLRETVSQSPRYTPAPPPSACGHYQHQRHTSHTPTPDSTT